MKPTRLGLLIFVILAAVAVAGAAQPRRTDPGEFASRALEWEELAALMAGDDPELIVVDVRTPGEYGSGAIPGAINIPHTELARSLPTDDRSARVVVYCRSGSRSAMAKAILEDLGFTEVNDFGGVFRWKGELVRRP